MANLIETPEWTAGIYQLEQDDLVLGGPDGIDNVQAKQLSNRTFWLKQQVESAQGDMVTHVAAVDPHPQYATDADLAAAVAALVNSSPATLDTLAEIATALSNDPNFATTITNALALKAPLASPALTGTPNAPTPAQFDSSQKLANTEFIKRQGLQFANYYAVSAATVLTAADAGKAITVNGSSTFSITLPSASGLPSGAMISLGSTASVGISVQRYGTDLIYPAQSGGITSFVILPGDNVILTSNGAGAWAVVSGSAMLPYSGLFGSNLASSGYQKLPSGLIIQWGTTTSSSASAGVSTAFPIAFPNSCLSVAFGISSSSTGLMSALESKNANAFVSSMYSGNTTRAAGVISFYIAVGA